ncbi:LAMI_0D01222g1_1 [Lachancea mirantina]|uniref:DASH complex subunit ASK1 n=1 Tax=Lachancea mirantina TaxID=1230905 RepID=A0A1G4J8K0_9SACH|nr:LAMI_0D01222g1_1 [Lachancea mirantina]
MTRTRVPPAMAEDSLERLDQEITLHLQQIDSNFSYCFSKIAQDIIPNVVEYGAVCDQVMDSCNWLKNMFQEAGNLQIDAVAGPKARPAAEPTTKRARDSATDGDVQTLFPAKPRLAGDSSSIVQLPAMQLKSLSGASSRATVAADPMVDVTTTTTTTGRVLQLPDSSDEEARDGDTDAQALGERKLKTPAGGEDADGSTMQRQRRKRKLSLLLQQQFGSSSSSAVPSPATQTKRNTNITFDSSPLRKEVANQGESTKEIGAPPGTVIHFPTGNSASLEDDNDNDVSDPKSSRGESRAGSNNDSTR